MTFTLFSVAQAAAKAKPFCVSHRAIGFGELENSTAALEAASKANATAIEFDLLHTKDNKTIVYHDKKLDRITTGSNCPKGELVHDITLKNIQDNCKLTNGESIPTFEASMKLLSGYDTTLFVELKDTITQADFDTIKRYYSDRPEKVLIISFNESALDIVLKQRLKDDFFKKVKTVQLKKYGYFGSFKKYDVVDAKYIHKSKVKRLQKNGKIVGVYTKDSEKRIKKYLKKGVDFITTNDTKLCERIINEQL